MGNFFYNCHQLKSVNLSCLDADNVINMSNMFYNCYKLENLDLSSFFAKKSKI